jgi:hypothetical protein
MQPVAKHPPLKPAEQRTPEDCILMLLRGIHDHLANAADPGGQQFLAELAALESKFEGKENAQTLAESALEALNRYGAQTSQTTAQQKSEVVTATAEVSEAVKALPGMQGNAERWNYIEQQIKSVSRDDDLELMKARLCANVAVARAEALQERQNIKDLFSGVIGKLNSAPSRPSGEILRPQGLVYAPDQLTGLPSRANAEAELARAFGLAPESFLALFVVKRLALINAKFGYAQGDQVLLKVVVHLSQALADFNSLFRWTPCAFLAVAPPNTSHKELRSKVEIIEFARLAPTLEWQGRTAMVPVVIDCRIISVKDFESPSELCLRLDTLASDV